MAKSKPSYQELKAELDEVLTWFESGNANVDEAIAKYEQGMKLVKELEDYLKTAENKIKKIRADLTK